MMMIKRYKIIFFTVVELFFITLRLAAQIQFVRYDTVEVVQDSLMSYPWAGGLHCPEFSDIDLNGDGKRDLFVHERWGSFVAYGNVSLTFLNGGSANKIDYTYSPEYESMFPYFSNWVLLRDFNCDGYQDAYYSVPGGIGLYKNVFSNQNMLSFESYAKMLYYKSSSGYDINIYVSSVDIPAIDDIDNDGDLDVVTFDILGGYIDYFQNRSIDEYGHCDSINYVSQENCWGYFYETSVCGNYFLNDTCLWIKTPSGQDQYKGMHSGSNVLTVDLDGDADKDLILGDISCSKLSMLTNDGTPSSAFIGSVDSLFPSYDTPADVYVYPAAYSLDVNNDSINDLLVAPNLLSGAKSDNNVWYYQNIGTTSNHVYSHVTNAFLQGEMIDVGRDAFPVFADYNADSLPDLFVGNYGYYESSGFVGKLALYENTGTKTMPQYTLISTDYENLSSLGLNALYPTFGDLDGDGDLDMLLGDAEGNIHYFENSAGSGSTMNLSLKTAYYLGIDVNQYAAPQLIDVNRDSLLDLIIGRYNGFISYYENLGTKSSPNLTWVTDSFGKVDTKVNGWYTGYSTPFMTSIDSTDAYYLFVGSESGRVLLYGNIDNNLNGAFTLMDSVVQHNTVGGRTAINLADINSDGKLEMIVGNFRGGVALFRESDSLITSNINKTKDNLPKWVNIYPNPASGIVYVDILNYAVHSNLVLNIYDILGNLMITENLGHHQSIDINGVNKGTYIVNIKDRDGQQQNFILLIQ